VGSVTAIEQVELGGRLGEFVVEEVLRGKALPVVEIPGFPIRGYGLLQPDPGQHDVPERRVAYLVAGGRTDKAAARALGISVNTVGTHLRSIYSKLAVQSRVQLANALRDCGELN